MTDSAIIPIAPGASAQVPDGPVPAVAPAIWPPLGAIFSANPVAIVSPSST